MNRTDDFPIIIEDAYKGEGALLLGSMDRGKAEQDDQKNRTGIKGQKEEDGLPLKKL